MEPMLVVVGADGPLGSAILDVLAERKFPSSQLKLVAKDPAEVDAEAFGDAVIPRSAADYKAAASDIHLLVDESAVAIGASHRQHRRISCFPWPVADDPVKTVAANLNDQRLSSVPLDVILECASPASVHLSLLLKPLAAQRRLRRVTVSSLYPVAYKGDAGIEELAGQAARLLNGLKVEKRQFAKQVAFNLNPEIESIDASGSTIEEQRLVDHTRELLAAPDLPITATCVQAGVFYALSQVVEIEFDAAVAPAEVSGWLGRADGIKVSQRRASSTAVDQGPGSEWLEVSRIRRAAENDCTVTLWCIGDYLRRGLALNAVQIAEKLIKGHL